FRRLRGGCDRPLGERGRRLIGMDKRSLSERDICTKFITPALRNAGWDEMLQIREEVSFTKGRIIVRGMLVTRGQGKRADYILNYSPTAAIARIEAGDHIRDGCLAPYKVVKVHSDRDVEGYRPEKGQPDRDGEKVEDRIYNTKDF